MNRNMALAYGMIAAIGLALAGIAAISLKPSKVETVQRGYRGVAMEANYTPAELATLLAANQAPEVIPSLGNDGPPSSTLYKNVQVLGHLTDGEFNRVMLAITEWVAPEQGCTYCHNAENMADDGLYTKVVARRMLQMTQAIDADWKPHVGATGVTCYTCHRGQPVPAEIWFHPPDRSRDTGMAMASTGKNVVSVAAGLSSLPTDPFTPYLENNYPIRVQSKQALPGTDHSSIKETDWTYALMIHYSQALGVNCTYCHNSRAFSDWQQSAPARTTAWYAAPMVRTLNDEYLKSLQAVFPPHRLGPEGDVAKINCATCHQGVYKPLFGAQMLKDYPELLRPTQAAAQVPADATPAAPPTQ